MFLQGCLHPPALAHPVWRRPAPLPRLPGRSAQRGAARAQASTWAACAGGTLRCELRWPEPFGGEGADVFRLVGRDTLSVASNLTVHGRSAGYTTVYRRRA